MENLREQSNMTHWWPRLESLDVRTPQTERIGMERIEIDDGAPDTDETVMVSVADMQALQDAIETVGGPPAFLRSDQLSAKHRMTEGSKLTSTDTDHLGRRRWTLLESHRMAMGVPSPECYYVREWLDLYHEFSAFTGCPIAAELRFFIYENDIWDVGFYWPKDAIRRPEIDDWERAWEMTEETAWEYEDAARRMVERVASEFHTYWSVDLALTMDKEWYVIDMARGELSWHPDSIEKPNGVTDPRTGV